MAVNRRPGPQPTPGVQSSLRAGNLSLISRAVFAAAEPVARVDLADITGLTRATVSRLVEELVGSRIVRKMDPARPSTQGRPALPIVPEAGTIAGIGLEVNVDYFAGRALDLTGATLSEFQIKGQFSGSDPEVVLKKLADTTVTMIQGLLGSGTLISGITLAIPGVVDARDGTLLVAPNLGWTDVPLADLMKRYLVDYPDIPRHVANDANIQSLCAAYAAPGRVLSPSTFIYVAGDKGIGGAMMVEGQVELGQHGWAGELGHMCVDVDGPECFCGSAGCLETFAGRSALLRAAGLDPADHSLTNLIELLGAGDAGALAAIERAGQALSVALANCVNLLDITRVVLGTGLGKLLPWLEPALTERTQAMSIGHSRSPVTIIAGTGGVTPACTGGALRSLRFPIEDPAGWIARVEG